MGENVNMNPQSSFSFNDPIKAHMIPTKGRMGIKII
jgi:hypothetical protein